MYGSLHACVTTILNIRCNISKFRKNIITGQIPNKDLTETFKAHGNFKSSRNISKFKIASLAEAEYGDFHDSISSPRQLLEFYR